ncbi:MULTISPECIES: DNA-binding protein [unclassified Luteococcus]|uniref:DNA-binding protein n=1 Tax=unclassified Luteococcus TaxID=2639923 RepID=UPI00313DCE9E
MSEDGREQQRALYGEPIADITARVQESLGLSQRRVAAVLGLSAPMLSLLVAGTRVKIGNPAAVQRLGALAELVGIADGLSAEELEQRLVGIADTHPTLTNTGMTDPAALLAASADAAELERLAGLTTAPALATLLRRAARHHG